MASRGHDDDGGRALAAQLAAFIGDERVLEAIRAVPRDRFVPPGLRAQAWSNEPLPIGEGQTISQPLIVARMCELLELTGDAINVAAASPAGVPRALEEQLAPGGRLVLPADGGEQRLMRIRRRDGGATREALEPVRFVPLVRG